MNNISVVDLNTFKKELRRVLLALGASDDPCVQAFVSHCQKFCAGTINSYSEWSDKLGTLSRASVKNKSVGNALVAITDSIWNFECGGVQREDIEACIKIYEGLREALSDSEPLATMLYRPVGPEELKLIEDADWTKFPPRLPEQPIFYPVTNFEYAAQIAERWNVKESGSGFVTAFKIEIDYISQFPIETVGGRKHQEYWIPSEELDEFNRHICGQIKVVKSY